MAGFPFAALFVVAQIFFGVLLLLVFTDLLLLYAGGKPVEAERRHAPRFSNGDQNPVHLHVQNLKNQPLHLVLVDEVPVQFQLRDFRLEAQLKPGQSKELTYYLRPVKRGEYSFGVLNVFVSSVLGLLARRVKTSAEAHVAVYPSYLQMHRFELMAHSQNLMEAGIKKIRKVGHNMEFEQIREYVQGDDYRSLNWKATARSGNLMVNQYQDEKSQRIYCLVDKGRTMQMPFEGIALLDYAINTSLVMANIAIKKQDKAGLLTFNRKVDTFLEATRRSLQMSKIMEALYKQSTGYKESNFEQLYIFTKRQIRQRSLLLLFTNFETLSGAERQLDYLRLMGKAHLLVVIFFVNTEIEKLLLQHPRDTEEVYIKTIAEKFAFEKRQVVLKLQQLGIQCIMSEPGNLTPATINKYLELKARNLI